MLQVQTISLALNGPNKLVTDGPKHLITPLKVGDTIISLDINGEYTIDIGQTVKFKQNIPYKVNTIEERANGYELVISSRTKACLFMLPMLGGKGTSSFYHTLLCNTYIALEDGKNCVAILFRFSGSADFLKFEQKLRQLPSFRTMIDPSPYFTLFVFDIPTDYLEDYQKFCLGQYSQLSATLKDKILKYHDSDANSVLGQVLYKSTKRRLRLQETLGVELDADAELLSIPDIEQETYNPAIYL